MVDEAAGRGDDQIEGLRQGLELVAVGAAAQDDGAANAQVLAVVAGGVGHLAGQFAGRCQHQNARGTLGAFFQGGQTFEGRQHKGGGLAGARLGAGDQVLAQQGLGNRLGLNGGRGGVAALEDGFEDGGGQVEFGKRHAESLLISSKTHVIAAARPEAFL